MKHNQVRQVVFPVITAMIWGTSFVAQSTSTEHVGAYTFNAARSFVGFLALLVVIQIFDAVNRRKQASASPSQEQSAPAESRKTLVIGGICCGFALALACNLQQLGMVAGAGAGKTSFNHHPLCGAGSHLRAVSQEKSLSRCVAQCSAGRSGPVLPVHQGRLHHRSQRPFVAAMCLWLHSAHSGY